MSAKFKFAACLLFSLCFLVSLSSPSEGRAVVLALSGGGGKGMAHIGVLKILEERDIPVAGIVGTSMGAIIGGLYAVGYSASEIEGLIEELDLTAILLDRAVPELVPAGEEEAMIRRPLFRLSFDEEGRLIGPKGGLSAVRLLNEIAAIVAQRAQAVDFYKLPIPFAAVATDLETGEAVILRRGNLASAMRASMAIPGLFEPWLYEGRLLVDGGLVANVPVRIAKELFPGYPVIAVDVSGGLAGKNELRSLADIVGQAITILTRGNVEEDLKFADLVIRPNVNELPLLDFSKVGEAVRLGEEAATAAFPELAKLAERAPSPPEFVAEKPLVARVAVTGLPSQLEREFLAKRSDWIGRELDVKAVVSSCEELNAYGDIRAVDYQIEEGPDGVALEFIAHRTPPRQLVLDGYASNLTPYRWLFVDATVRDIASEGDELKTRFLVGEQWGARLAYFWPAHGGERTSVRLDVQDWEVEPEGRGGLSWTRYNLALNHHISWGKFRASYGLMAEWLDGSGDEESWGPMAELAYLGLDDPLDPKSGVSARFLGWYAEEELLARLSFRMAASPSESWRLLLEGGAEIGDESIPAHAATLGGLDELLSRAYHPLMGENALWLRATLRHPLVQTWWGGLNADLFVGAGATYDGGWGKMEDAWEVGVALSVPSAFFGGSIYAVYDDRSDWTFGFSIGAPPLNDEPVRQ